MDFLLSAGEELRQTVFFATADLFSLEVDVLLYDTTRVDFEMEDDDLERAGRAERTTSPARRGAPSAPPAPRPGSSSALRLPG